MPYTKRSDSMKLVLSSQGHNKSDLVDVRFGRCKYFAIYDLETKTFDFVENKGAESNQGAGIAAAQTVLDLKADALLTERLGPKAFRVLADSGMKLYKCHGMTIEDAVNRFENHTYETIDGPYR